MFLFIGESALTVKLFEMKYNDIIVIIHAPGHLQNENDYC